MFRVDVFCEIKKRVKRAARVKVDIIIKTEAQLPGLAATIYCEKKKRHGDFLNLFFFFNATSKKTYYNTEHLKGLCDGCVTSPQY